MAVLKYKDVSGQYVPISNYTVQPIDPVQTTGSSTTAIMSQNAVTVALNDKANSVDVYTQTQTNNLIFGQNTVPSGSGEATNVQQLINKTVYGTTTPSQAQKEANVVTTENLTTTLSGYATLDSTGKVPSTQLPSYVDDVIEGYYYNSKFYKEAAHTTLITGESDKIYVDLSTDTTYRCSNVTNQTYTQIKGDLALGETSSTAYRGDRGKIAYEHSQAAHAPANATVTSASTTNGNIKINDVETTVYTHPSFTAQTAAAKKVGMNAQGHVVLGDSLTATDVGLGNVGNFKAVSTVANQGLNSTEQANARANIGAGTSLFSGNYNDLNDKPTLGDAAAKAVDSSIAASSSSGNLPTSAAVASFVEGKGYKTTDTTYKFTIGNTTKGDSANGVDLGTLESKAAAASGTDLSLVTTGEKNIWNNKQDAIVFNTAYNANTNKAATMSDIPSVPTHRTAASGGTDLSVVTTGEMYTWNNKSNLVIGTTAGTAFDGADGATAKAETDFMTGINTTNSIASIPVTKRLVKCTATSGTFSLASIPPAGREIHIILAPTSAGSYQIPNTGNYVLMNDNTTMNVAAGKYGEINVISDGDKGYIRYAGA